MKLFLQKKLLTYLCKELIVAFIRLADLIINVDCIATVRLSTHSGCCEGMDIPVVDICLTIPEGSLDGDTSCCEKCKTVETLEFESDLALAIWDYFSKSSDVTVLFE
jgi:hypothetical protein